MADKFRHGEESTDRASRRGGTDQDSGSTAGKKKTLKSAFEVSFAHDKPQADPLPSKPASLSLYRRAKLFQFKALVAKELRLQSKQVFASLCQVPPL